MRVLHVIPAVAPRYGGPSTTIVAMCRALNASGCETVTATTDADGPSSLNVALGAETQWADTRAVFFRRTWSEAFKYSRDLSMWLDQHVTRFDAVHIHAILSHAPLAAARACRRHNVPYVVRPLGTLDPWSLEQKWFRKRVLLMMGGKRALHGAAAVHYTSAEERDATERAMGIANGVVVPLGIAVDDEGGSEAALRSLPASTATEPAPYILVLSRLHPVKNLENLIAAFADVRAKHPTFTAWRLVVAGDGEPAYVSTLKSMVTGLRLDEAVEFQGWVDGERKRDLIRRASMYALTSFHENFGVSLVEALAAGVPALVSEGVHLASVIRDGRAGWVVGVARDGIANGLERALGSDAERREKSIAARQLAAQFAWPRVAEQLIDLYARVTAGRPAVH